MLSDRRMAFYIIIAAVVNMSLGFAAAVWLAGRRQTATLIDVESGLPPENAVAAEATVPNLAAAIAQPPAAGLAAGIQGIPGLAEHFGDQMGALESLLRGGS